MQLTLRKNVDTEETVADIIELTEKKMKKKLIKKPAGSMR